MLFTDAQRIVHFLYQPTILSSRYRAYSQYADMVKKYLVEKLTAVIYRRVSLISGRPENAIG